MNIDSNTINNLLTPADVAKFLKISKVGVYRLTDKRLIRFYKIGGSLRFAKADIIEYLKDNKVESIIKK